MKFSIVIDEKLNEELKRHLIHIDYQEDLCFALYSLASGKTRVSGIINKAILPEQFDRNLHGNVSFNPEYFDRVIGIARKEKKGIVFLHSHLGPGWQGMSKDDIETEKMLAPRVKAATGFPLLGMTIGSNGDWSGRFWNKKMPQIFVCDWCESVRVIGKRFQVTFNDNLLKSPVFQEEFTRTKSAWGDKRQGLISRIKVGVVGIGSVGSQITEALMRTGIQEITLIDFDLVQRRNLDRLHGINSADIGYLKSDVYVKYLTQKKLYHSQMFHSVPHSIVEKEGYEALIDCDIVFCCVDKPWARFILNCISYSYLIPVIDGGIDADYSTKKDNLDQARWRTFITGSGRRCIKCMEQYSSEEVALEQSGLLEDPEYIKGLPEDHFSKKGENVYAFSMSLASLEMQQFLSYVLTPKGVIYGPKEMDFVTGNIDQAFEFQCDDNCEFTDMIGIGDQIKNSLIHQHPAAEACRQAARKSKKDVRSNNGQLKNFFKYLLGKNHFKHFLQKIAKRNK